MFFKKNISYINLLLALILFPTLAMSSGQRQCSTIEWMGRTEMGLEECSFRYRISGKEEEIVFSIVKNKGQSRENDKKTFDSFGSNCSKTFTFLFDAYLYNKSVFLPTQSMQAKSKLTDDEVCEQTHVVSSDLGTMVGRNFIYKFDNRKGEKRTKIDQDIAMIPLEITNHLNMVKESFKEDFTVEDQNAHIWNAFIFYEQALKQDPEASKIFHERFYLQQGL